MSGAPGHVLISIEGPAPPGGSERIGSLTPPSSSVPSSFSLFLSHCLLKSIRNRTAFQVVIK